MNKASRPKRSAASWLAELAKGRYGEYTLSVLAALLGVACSLAPYFIIIRLIAALVNGTAELMQCLTLCGWMAGFWVLRYVLHSVSTSLSHHATFYVLAHTRTRLLDKLATLPLGTVLDRSSGSYKNIIVERVDSIETTLAHLLPEMTTNIIGALAVLVLLFIKDWRMGLSMLIVVPLGIICFMSMFSGYHEKFQRTVTATKALNDTAVEYISGIEVIKAFGQSKTSYAKFVSAAKEGADCFIDWMQGSLFGQAAGMAILPSTLLGILPVGCLLSMHGTLSAETFLAVIVLSFGVMQPLITAFSYTDDIAQVKTIVGEVAEVLSGEDMQRPTTAEKCGCHAFIMGLENGYQTICGASDGHLSGGERQRISIARAVLKDAPIVILDEATASVDPENEKELMEAVSELTHDKTVIMIAHRLKTVRDADKIFVVDHGKLVQQGTHDELVAIPGKYKEFIDIRKKAEGWSLAE